MTTEPPTGTSGLDLTAEQMIALTRTLTVLVASDGTVLDARGGFGGFIGLDTENLVGTNVFDFVAEDEAGQLATYFIENADESPDTIALPVPFRMTVVDDDGLAHAVDIIPTGMRVGDEIRWVAVLVPVALFGSITRSLDLEMEGADRADVKRMLCEELAADNANYTNRWMLIEFGDGDRVDVTTSRPEDHAIADAVRRDVVDGWEPWRGLAPAAIDTVALSAIGTTTLPMMIERGWQRSIVAPVHVRDRLAGVYLLLGRVPDSFPATLVTANVAARIEKLVRATALLMQRWETVAQLRIDAAHDPLTGLHNARSLQAAIDGHDGQGSVLFVDVDRFKQVNDTHGHAAGDLVLIEIADRLLDACGPDAIVARLGGDEFVILLSRIDVDAAADVGRRILDAVARPLGLDDGPTAVSVSVGVAALDPSNAFEAADRAMLTAKRSGRGQLALAPPD